MTQPGELTRRTVVARLGPDGYRTEVESGPHALVADEPVEVGGADLGPSPYDLLLAALGACKAMTMRMYAARKGWPLEGATVRLTHTKTAPDASGRADEIAVAIELEGPLTDEQRARLVDIAGRCPVHRTIEQGVRFTAG